MEACCWVIATRGWLGWNQSIHEKLFFKKSAGRKEKCPRLFPRRRGEVEALAGLSLNRANSSLADVP